MNIQQIKEEIGQKNNCLADASVINTQCLAVYDKVVKELQNSSGLGQNKLYKNTIKELEKIPILYKVYKDSVKNEAGILSGDSFHFASLANTAYNALDGL